MFFLSFEYILIVAGLLLLISVFASKVANKFGVPALLLFLFIGMLAGSEGIGGLSFENYNLAKTIGDLALIFILFTGGLETEWKSIRPVLVQGLIMSTFGVALTMLFLGTFAWFMLGSFSSVMLGSDGINWVDGLLLGAIISSTDAAAVFSILKSSNLKLKGNLQPLLELESGSNDPMAVLLTTTLVNIVKTGDVSFLNLGITLIAQLAIGIIGGYGFGRLMTWIINNIKVNAQGLYPVISLGQVLLTYSVITLLQGNGFLGVYIAGVVLGNSNFTYKSTILDFHDAISWLMQIGMFLLLGLLVFPSQLITVAPIAIIIALFLMFIARPLSVIIGLAISPYNNSEKLFISWVGLRGAVPIILAISPIAVGIPDAKTLFNVVFFIVLISVSIQGFSLGPTARWLKLENKE
ncbi:potassium/proton antiporter [Crocosphaera watsonii]|uniref:Sodium/hydrogen exchanger n=4 Tax=Crocosphaera TaxID=263510 RepID=G5J944_CROWT|nr:potassium/proton antiporter [Crocosphaera watsonii]EHJ11321.1 sodium/hydrogen exchanger [Crocosphaera watsonii WH 0003]CCQ56024.1 Na(+)/H(+) antiporter [Crocosphaera watsonii WH 0005]